MNYILFSTKSVIELYKNNINNLLDAKEIDFDLFHVLHNSSLEEILCCAIKWSGFVEIPEKDYKELFLLQQRIMGYKDSVINKLNNTCQNNFNDST